MRIRNTCVAKHPAHKHILNSLHRLPLTTRYNNPLPRSKPARFHDDLLLAARELPADEAQCVGELRGGKGAVGRGGEGVSLHEGFCEGLGAFHLGAAGEGPKTGMPTAGGGGYLGIF